MADTLNIIVILFFIGSAVAEQTKPNLGVVFGEPIAFEGIERGHVRLFLFVDDYVGFCAGTMVYRDLILTAAHCLAGIKRVLICGGSPNCYPTSEDKSSCVFVNAEDFGYIHKGFIEAIKVEQFYDDIALIKMPSLITNQNVSVVPLCRLEGCGCDQNIYDLKIARICGCGEIETGEIPNKLVGTKVATLSSEKGIHAFKVFNTVRYQDKYKVICAISAVENPASNSCFGDSGGPLILFNPKTHIEEQCGIVSFGGPRCDGEFPDCYTMVGYYLDFIYGLKNAVIVSEANQQFKAILGEQFKYIKSNKFGIKNEIKNEKLKARVFTLLQFYKLISKSG